MGRYIARKRARFHSFGREVNIPWGAVLEEQDGSLFWKGKLLCGITSQNAYDYFSRDDDGQGKLRGQLVEAIKDRLEKRDKGYQAVEPGVGGYEVPAAQAAGSMRLVEQQLPRFYNAPISDLSTSLRS
ncbi:MAG: isoaspartyl peptidase [Oscillospiraceae bacterium]